MSGCHWSASEHGSFRLVLARFFWERLQRKIISSCWEKQAFRLFHSENSKVLLLQLGIVSLVEATKPAQIKFTVLLCLFLFCVGSHVKQWKDVLPFLLGNSLEKGKEGGCYKKKNAVQNCLVTLTLEYWCCRSCQGWSKLRLDLICLEICQWQDHLLSWSLRKVERKVSREK